MNQEKETELSKYLTFTLGQEIFALDIRQVREVLDFTDVTRVPKMPDFMRGVINLRGRVVPVLDLRLKFGMTPTEKTVDTCIIIMEIVLDKDTTLLGSLADSVQEVMSLEQDQVEPAPKIGTSLRTGYIKGMGKKGRDFIIVLDIDNIFSHDEVILTGDADKRHHHEAGNACLS